VKPVTHYNFLKYRLSIVYFHFSSVLWYSHGSNRSKLRSPNIIQIQTQNACNAHCKMCLGSISSKPRPNTMSDRLYKKIVDQISGSNVKIVLFNLWNEPTLDKQIFDKIRYLKEQTTNKVIVDLITNGSLLHHFKSEEIESSGLDFLSVSLDAFSDNTYKKIRHNLKFEQVIRNIDRLSSIQKPQIIIKFVEMKENAHEFNDCKSFWNKRNIPVSKLNLTNRAGLFTDYSNSKSHNIISGFHIIKSVANRCMVPFSHLCIYANGDVVICCHDYYKSTLVGNLNSESIHNIWNNFKMNTYRKRIYQNDLDQMELCRTCSSFTDK